MANDVAGYLPRWLPLFSSACRLDASYKNGNQLVALRSHHTALRTLAAQFVYILEPNGRFAKLLQQNLNLVNEIAL
jgi:hypothetical protein